MTKSEFESLLCTITSNAVSILAEKNGLTEDEALERFTASKVYAFLEDEKTKVWQYSATMLAQLFDDECSENLKLPEV